MDIYKIEALIKTHFNNFLLLVVLLVMLSAATPVSAYDQPWNGNREDITSTTNEPPPSTCPSGNCSCDGTGSPVYLADGSLVWRDTDIRLPSSTRVGLKRTYNSFDQRAGLFGRGWVTAQESSIARTYKALDQGNADGSPSTATNFGSVPIWLASYGRRYKLQETATTCTPPGVLYFTFEKQANGNFKQVFEDNQSYSIYDANGKVYELDDGVRADSTLEKLAKLRPAFDKPYGLVTPGNSAQITDGAAALVVASESAVKKYDLPVMARIVSTEWAALSPSEMGLGPAHSIAPLLKSEGLKLESVDYWEINEAFAAQVLAVIAALKDSGYCKKHLGLRSAVGEIPLDKLKIHGGGVSLGHPVGASGARIVLHLAKILEARDVKRGIASLCIGGGQGGAMLLERETSSPVSRSTK